QDLGGRRIGIGLVNLGAPVAGKVEQNQIAAAPPDFQANEVGAIRIERERHQRLADLAALRLFFAQKTIGLQQADNHRDGLRGKSGAPGDLSLGKAAVAADEGEKQTGMIGAKSRLMGSAGNVGRCQVSSVSHGSTSIAISTIGATVAQINKSDRFIY